MACIKLDILNSEKTCLKWHYSKNFEHSEMGVRVLYFGARYYDSDISVWLSVDPLADRRVYESPYSYCGNNPVVRIDKDGEFWHIVGAFAVGAAADLIGQVAGNIASGKKAFEKIDWGDVVVSGAETAVIVAYPGLAPAAKETADLLRASVDITYDKEDKFQVKSVNNGKSLEEFTYDYVAGHVDILGLEGALRNSKDPVIKFAKDKINDLGKGFAKDRLKKEKSRINSQNQNHNGGYYEVKNQNDLESDGKTVKKNATVHKNLKPVEIKAKRK